MRKLCFWAPYPGQKMKRATHSIWLFRFVEVENDFPVAAVYRTTNHPFVRFRYGLYALFKRALMPLSASLWSDSGRFGQLRQDLPEFLIFGNSENNLSPYNRPISLDTILPTTKNYYNV